MLVASFFWGGGGCIASFPPPAVAHPEECLCGRAHACGSGALGLTRHSASVLTAGPPLFSFRRRPGSPFGRADGGAHVSGRRRHRGVCCPHLHPASTRIKSADLPPGGPCVCTRALSWLASMCLQLGELSGFRASGRQLSSPLWHSRLGPTARRFPFVSCFAGGACLCGAGFLFAALGLASFAAFFRSSTAGYLAW